VEWTDLQGTQDWTEDSEQHPRISFANPAHPGQKVTITPRFLRGWHKLEDGTIVTSAVLEWYVWPQGGHWSPNPWFWQDWLAQWRSQRLPWIAVAILIPLEPLGQAETAWPVLEPLAEIVQQELDALLVAH
jgi:cyanoexosortase B-associated protein